MKRIKQHRGWAIYKNTAKELAEHGFEFTVIHPNNVGCGLCSPSDSDMECNSLEDALLWIDNYDTE